MGKEEWKEVSAFFWLSENEGNDLSDIDNIKKISTNNEEGQ